MRLACEVPFMTRSRASNSTRNSSCTSCWVKASEPLQPKLLVSACPGLRTETSGQQTRGAQTLVFTARRSLSCRRTNSFCSCSGMDMTARGSFGSLSFFLPFEPCKSFAMHRAAASHLRSLGVSSLLRLRLLCRVELPLIEGRAELGRHVKSLQEPVHVAGCAYTEQRLGAGGERERTAAPKVAKRRSVTLVGKTNEAALRPAVMVGFIGRPASEGQRRTV